MYASFVCDHSRPPQKKSWRVRLVIGRDKVHHSDNTVSLALNVIDTKISLTKDTGFFRCDLKYLFLASPKEEPKYMKVPIKFFPFLLCQVV